MNPSHNILIVDDEIVFATQIGDILSDLGHEATLLHSAEYALTRLSAPHSFDLMLLDVHMPGMTGIELVRATADLPNRPPIILMTAFSSLPTALECLKLGAEDYITKPFDLDLLLLTIDRALDRANMQRQNRELNRMLMVHTHNTVRGQQAMRGLVQMLNLLPASRDLPQAMLEVLSYVHRILESDYSTLTLQMEQHPIRRRCST
jgi:two-component system response regulator HydG